MNLSLIQDVEKILNLSLIQDIEKIMSLSLIEDIEKIVNLSLIQEVEKILNLSLIQDVEKIVNLPMDEFAAYAMSHNFNEEQMNVLRDIRWEEFHKFRFIYTNNIYKWGLRHRLLRL